jgi:hypothetical protein
MEALVMDHLSFYVARHVMLKVLILKGMGAESAPSKFPHVSPNFLNFLGFFRVR